APPGGSSPDSLPGKARILSPDGSRLLTLTPHGTSNADHRLDLMWWEGARCAKSFTVGPLSSLPWSAPDLARDGTRLAGQDEGGAIRVWDTATGQEIGPATLRFYGNAWALSPDGRRLALCQEGAVRVLDVGTGQEVAACAILKSQRAAHPAFGPGGHSLV